VLRIYHTGPKATFEQQFSKLFIQKSIIRRISRLGCSDMPDDERQQEFCHEKDSVHRQRDCVGAFGRNGRRG
jgi:hypothetical protein